MKRRDFITLLGGAAATWPLAARAQSPQRMARIGYLGAGFRTSPLEAFLQGLRELGYVEGQTFTLVERYAEGRQERLPELAVELVRLGVDIIVAGTSAASRPSGPRSWPSSRPHGLTSSFNGAGEGTRFISPIACPDAPPRPDPLSDDALRTVGALVQALRSLPDVLPNALGILGHSRGGGATLNYILRKADVRAAVLNSARYPSELRGLASELKVPLLMLHGTADSPADGGN